MPDEEAESQSYESWPNLSPLLRRYADGGGSHEGPDVPLHALCGKHGEVFTTDIRLTTCGSCPNSYRKENPFQHVFFPQ